MAKAITNYIIDVLMGIAFIVCAATGLAVFFFIPRGVPQGGYQVLLGIAKGTWVDVHNWSGIILVILVAIHLVLHFKWCWSMTKAIFKKKAK